VSCQYVDQKEASSQSLLSIVDLYKSVPTTEPIDALEHVACGRQLLNDRRVWFGTRISI